jgi:uncharacterized membrane protein HdeD (DUF308 family)
VAVTSRASEDEVKRARSLLGSGACAVAVGIALTGTAFRTPGALVLLTGWLLLVAGIHAFGRTGPDRRGEAPTKP